MSDKLLLIYNKNDVNCRSNIYIGEQLICSRVKGFSIDKQSLNLPNLKLKHIQHYDFIGVNRFLSNFVGDKVNMNLERLMKNIVNPF